jgi:hypothetical protein
MVTLICSILLLLAAFPCKAATIMLVTDRADLEQGTAGLAGYLRQLGYDVEVSASPGNASEFRTLDATKISRLTSKDLVILHRATSSGDFNTDATERSTWNNMNVPILVGATMNAGFIAPARRVQLFLEDNTAAALNDTGRQLVHAAISWALGMAPDCPRLLTPVFSGRVVRLSFDTDAGFTYVVEYKDSLSDAVWTELATVPGTGSVETVEDPNPSPTGTRFYRFRF